MILVHPCLSKSDERWPSYTYYLGIQKLAYTGYTRSCVQFLEVFWLYSGHFLRYCKTSNRCATKNSRIFEIATEFVHELISAANNSCNQTINVENISGRAISSALYIYCIDKLILAFFQCKHNFLGFTILRIHDYDPELGTSVSDAHVM